MIRNAVRATTVLLATLAVPAVIFAAPLSASAANKPLSASAANNLCETNGNNYCLGSADLNLYTAVTESKPGRNLIATPLGGTFDGFSTYLLQFSADATKCVASADNLVDIVIHPCNGGSGVVWAKDSITGHIRWINREVSQHYNQDMYLSGASNGTPYFTAPLRQTGVYQRFDWV
jgi:hypothetical protein